MKHILTILIMMLALGSYASEPSVTDSISSQRRWIQPSMSGNRG